MRLYPPFGLMGQDRSRTPALEEVLQNAGIDRRQRVGVLGWKYYSLQETAKPETWFETPAFIVDTLRKIVGEDGRVINANALLMDSTTGLRAVNEIEQIAQFEFGAVAASEAIKALFRNLKPGMTEFEAVQSMGLGVMPHTCHTMLSTGVAPRRAQQPVGQGHRTRRPADHGGRLSRRPQLAHGLCRRGRVADPSRMPATMSSGSPRHTSPAPPSGTRPSASASPAARSTRWRESTSARRSSTSSSIPATSSTSTSG